MVWKHLIKNAGMNYPPQATNSSIMKYVVALWKRISKKTIWTTKLNCYSVHDQQVSEVREDYAEQWAFTQTELMEKQQCMLYHQEF
jgi:DNA polymerase I-like protein with 3'-5' exonuclease and polymerase domains